MGALESRIRDVEGGIAATRQQDAANNHFRGGYRYDERDRTQAIDYKSNCDSELACVGGSSQSRFRLEFNMLL